jgi:hypothetical protein
MKPCLLLTLLVAHSTASVLDSSFISALQKRQLPDALGLPKGFQLSNLSPAVLAELSPLIRAALGGNASLGRYFGDASASKI